MLNVRVQNFGPVIDASVEVNRLTFFVGPNGAGKSYLSLVLYAVFRAYRVARGTAGRRFRLASKSTQKVRVELRRFFEFVRDRQRAGSAESNLSMSEISPRFRRVVFEVTRDLLQEFEQALQNELQRVFAGKLPELINRPNAPCSITITQTSPDLHLEFLVRRNKLSLHATLGGLADVSLPTDRLLLETSYVPRIFDRVLPTLRGGSHYLPAARSGVLQSHKVIASAALHRLSVVGIEDIEIPRMSGVVVDFISTLLVLTGDEVYDEDLVRTAAFIERNLAKGRIKLQERVSKTEYPEVLFVVGRKSFPMHRSSSMVSEVAPLILFLRHVLKQEDVLIIEEPEAHLDPNNQRVMARAIAQMLRAGLRVILTTHSDYFLQQLSNLVLLSRTKTDLGSLKRNRESISYSDVSGYLLRPSRGGLGSKAKRLPVTEKEGISLTVFTDIANALYNETVALERRAN